MDSSRDVNSDPRRSLPSVHRLSAAVIEQRPGIPEWAAVEGARQTLESARAALDLGQESREMFRDPFDAWVEEAAHRASEMSARRPRRVVNATGIVLHTNLGRAPMAPGAAAAAAEAAVHYSDLELDLSSGRRGDRLAVLDQKLRLLSGAEATYACNNCAAALLLALNTLAVGREVIVSRGELVEIGGSFRIPEIMRRAGVTLVEVGSTNRTHPSDYIDAIGPATAMLLKVHRSNFEVRGFVAEVSLRELAQIGTDHGVPVVEDLGSGTLVDLQPFGFPPDSYAPARLREGPDLVCFSGDKLMGGPQAGIILGRARFVEAMRKNPLARALRLDKMTLAALDWTCGAMLEGTATSELPVLRQILMPLDRYEARTRSFAKALAELSPPPDRDIEVHRERVPIGGGSLPGVEIDSWVIALRDRSGAEGLARRLRDAAVPILARVRDDFLLIDLRTVDDDDERLLSDTLVSALR